MMVVLNNMSVKTSDIMIAYNKYPCGEKLYTILGPEFGQDEGKMMIIVGALYGVNIAGESFQNHLAECMQFMRYKPCLSDPDLWMTLMKRSSNDFYHYECILIYVRDVLAISDNTTEFLQNIGRYFGLNPGSLSDLNIYLVQS